MKAEQLQLALRPRPVYEAVDLGVRMTQQAAASLRHGYLPLALLLVLAYLGLQGRNPPTPEATSR